MAALHVPLSDRLPSGQGGNGSTTSAGVRSGIGRKSLGKNQDKGGKGEREGEEDDE
jgi:hypothetical protein